MTFPLERAKQTVGPHQFVRFLTGPGSHTAGHLPLRPEPARPYTPRLATDRPRRGAPPVTVFSPATRSAAIKGAVAIVLDEHRDAIDLPTRITAAVTETLAELDTPADACPLHSPDGDPCDCGHAAGDDCHPNPNTPVRFPEGA